jgi:hypothetical protein
MPGQDLQQVDLPAPFGPIRPTVSPDADLHVDVARAQNSSSCAVLADSP